HELYFASRGGDGRKPTELLAAALARDFGSVERWRSEFVAMGNALGGGSGWVLLVHVPRDGRLINQNASDHSQTLAGGVPILALDMYEHAYHLDFGANASAYVGAFMRNIDWNAVQGRYKDASEAALPAACARPASTHVAWQAITRRGRRSSRRSSFTMVPRGWRPHEYARTDYTADGRGVAGSLGNDPLRQGSRGRPARGVDCRRHRPRCSELGYRTGQH